MFIRDLEKFGFRFPFHSPDDDLSVISDKDVTLEKEENTEEEEKEEDKEEEEDKEIEEEEEEKEDEEEETEEKEEEEEDEDTEEDEDDSRYTTFKDIKAKYPNFFKEFPDLRAALAREQQYSEHFGSPEDAKLAVAQASALQAIEEDLLNKNDPRGLIDTIHKDNPEAVEKILFNLLPYLSEKHKDLYFEVAAVPIKQLLRNAWSEGKGKETDLGKAAAIIHKFFFNDYNFGDKVKGEGAKISEKTDREKELEERLSKIEESKTNDFLRTCDDSYLNRMTKLIRERLDQDERLTDYMRSKLVEDTLSDIKKQLDSDSRYKSQMQSILRQARVGEYSNDYKSRVVSTALARAKSLIPEVTKKLISQATKTGKVKDSEEEKEKKKLTFKPGSKKAGSKKETNKPVSDLDILRAGA